ncbi:MAG TPA: hypothetical protein VGO59_08850 [Verrucomicrobiae bacterium]|jgi:hypothetical protein
MKPRTEVVATFDDLEKAQAVKVKLEKAGIEANVKDESRMQKFWFLSKPHACEKVLVKESEYTRARQFLLEADQQDGILHGEVHCLQCGSPHIQYPQYTRKFLTTTFFGVIFYWMGLMDKLFYCRDCHCTWPVKELLREPTDILNWPKRHEGGVKQERG